MIPPALWPYLMKVYSMNWSLHRPFHILQMCRVTCCPWEIALDMWMKLLHETEVVEAIPGIVDMASCKVVGKHLPECGQMEKPLTFTFSPDVRHHQQHWFHQDLNPKFGCPARTSNLIQGFHQIV
ncbi:hypothetical protein CesoFtcFv8_001514 [Champsocephalus esox]|uniref:Uncharacterized protein n=1 Tax=Champsocephalus esox TaxID=159716 RepID=A0AAN8HKV3_9TELE|nr:hypothetical protein CesoFtcFv8_001514 [Champsocephalus esox]